MKVLVCSGLGQVWGEYTPDILFQTRDDKRTVGGGEAAFLETSFGLAALGHTVTVFYPGKAAEYLGVMFRPLGEAYEALSSEDFDAVISWSDPQAIRVAPKRMRRIYAQQLNDMPEDVPFWRNLDALVPASAIHGRFLMSIAPKGAEVTVIPLYGGVRKERYANALPWSERKPIVSYWSSPDRGLHNLLLMWPEIRAAVPGSILRIFYHLDRFIDGTKTVLHRSSFSDLPWRARIMEKLTRPCPPDIEIYGAIGRVALAKHQGETKIWAFPFDPVYFTEGLCASAGEAIAAGCWPIARPADALPEVYGNAIQWIHGGVVDSAHRERFANAIIHALRFSGKEHPYTKRGQEFIESFTWMNASLRLQSALYAAPITTEGEWREGVMA